MVRATTLEAASMCRRARSAADSPLGTLDRAAPACCWAAAATNRVIMT